MIVTTTGHNQCKFQSRIFLFDKKGLLLWPILRFHRRSCRRWRLLMLWEGAVLGLWVTNASLMPDGPAWPMLLEKGIPLYGLFLSLHRCPYLAWCIPFYGIADHIYFPLLSTLCRMFKFLVRVQIVVHAYLLFWLLIIHTLCSVLLP